jgi:hypothetical protein
MRSEKLTGGRRTLRCDDVDNFCLVHGHGQIASLTGAGIWTVHGCELFVDNLRQRPQPSRVLLAGVPVCAEWARTRIVRGHIQFVSAPGPRRNRVHGFAALAAMSCSFHADVPRARRDYFADAEALRKQGVKRALS